MNILMVCTGNICRSPTAEGVLRHHLQAQGLADRVAVDSAGTHGYHIGDPPDPRTIRTALQYGVDLRPLRARQVEAADFERFDLLLAMDDGHYRALQKLQLQNPSGQRNTGNIRYYLDFAAKAGLRELPDPYYGGNDGFERVFRLCEAATEGLLAHIRQHM
ncbi:low molecular weight protein-tyrosine-phosphatase [Ferrovibrio sp.]|uniref:low molecular weight protein-tyrosine-phosphatase n=1 Tax=Ferrovibrio sp. TaxID=1917215 RepID=UPI0025C4D0BC|nr:low molecular weight protein-tyrosine-phosphatase [Ferrovibrio sp.]